MAAYQYRIKVSGAEGLILNALPSQQWSYIAMVIEERGGVAVLERRAIFDEPLEGVTFRMGDNHITRWEDFAKMEG